MSDNENDNEVYSSEEEESENELSENEQEEEPTTIKKIMSENAIAFTLRNLPD